MLEDSELLVQALRVSSRACEHNSSASIFFLEMALDICAVLTKEKKGTECGRESNDAFLLLTLHHRTAFSFPFLFLARFL